jgi:hypothetical protein
MVGCCKGVRAAPPRVGVRWPLAEVPDAFLAEVLPFLERCATVGEAHEG